MTAASAYRRALAALGLFTLMAGDFWRYLLSWWGWGAIVGVLLILTIVELVRARVSLRRTPIALVVLLAWMTASIVWSAYPGSSAIGVALTLAATAFALLLARAMTPADVVQALSWAVRTVLLLSLAFEAIVALVIGHRILPLWVDYSDLDKIPAAFYWSRDLLLQGGQIQGIVGNSNLLAFAALLGVVVFGVEWAREPLRRVSTGIWIGLAIVTLALTRSSTVFAAAAGVAVLLLGALLVRRAPAGRRVLPTLGFVAVVIAAAVAVFLARGPILAFLQKSPDLTNRFDIWRAVLGLIEQRPVLGWGWVTYWPPWEEPFRDLVEIRGVHYYMAHNAWLDAVLQIGLIGALLLAAFVAVALVRAWITALDAPRGRDLALAVLPLLLLGMLLVHSLAESRMLFEIGWVLLVWSAWEVTARPWVRARDREVPEELAATGRPPEADA
ncbi:MAG: O-antigen ligase family protein [Actinomycetales bacterium]|nr:O-antigen ligase family protein [Actinomycetales bacterium]